MNNKWRLLIDGPQDSQWNMCVDEALLLNGSTPTVRFYSWKVPTVSYGYFQSHHDFTDIPDHWQRVRRLTGGGAIIHHHEITFSMTGPCHHPLLKDTKKLYQHVHQAWQESLSHYGVPTKSRGGKRRTDQSPKWCFSKPDPLDLIVDNGDKLLGSAQRRQKERVLLHGSLPLTKQTIMGGTGLEMCLNKGLEWYQTLNHLLPTFSTRLKMELAQENLTKSELSLAKKIMAKRYQSDDWLVRRISPNFLEKIEFMT